jgi:hypothetical protein
MALHVQFRFPIQAGGRWSAFLLGLLIAATAKAAPADEAAIIERLERLEARQARLETELRLKDELIDKLESALAGTEPLEPAAPSATNRWLADDAVVFQTASLPVVARREPVRLAAVSAPNGSAGGADDLEHYGEFQPGGRGFKLADTPFGTVNFSAWTYIRYLNQQQLDNDSEDSFGRPRSIDRRNDLQLNKVNLYFKGWSTIRSSAICSTPGPAIPARARRPRSWWPAASATASTSI